MFSSLVAVLHSDTDNEGEQIFKPKSPVGKARLCVRGKRSQWEWEEEGEVAGGITLQSLHFQGTSAPQHQA